MTNAEFAQSLRQVADFYEAHPDMPVPGWPGLIVSLRSREAFLKAAVELAKGGRVEKKSDHPDAGYPYFHAKRVFGGVIIDVQIPRNLVCRLVSPAVYDCPDSLLAESKEYTGVEA